MAEGGPYLLGLDAGNTVIKAVLFDLQGRQLASHCIDGVTRKPAPGMVERSVGEVWDNAREAISGCVAEAGIDARDIAAIGTAGHGNGLYLLDRDGLGVTLAATNGLDPAARRRMLKLIIEMKSEQGMNVLVCSHLLRDIEQVCDEAVIMKDGAIVHHCNLEVERRSNRSFVELEVSGDDGSLRAALPEIGAEGVSEGFGRWRIVLPPGADVENGVEHTVGGSKDPPLHYDLHRTFGGSKDPPLRYDLRDLPLGH